MLHYLRRALMETGLRPRSDSSHVIWPTPNVSNLYISLREMAASLRRPEVLRNKAESPALRKGRAPRPELNRWAFPIYGIDTHA